MAVGWLGHILSQGNHKLNHVQPWAEGQQTVLRNSLDEQARGLDWSDDRLATVLDYFSKDEPWDVFETALGQHEDHACMNWNPRLSAWTARRVVVMHKSPQMGCCSSGTSLDHRPDLPQLKMQLSVLDPFALPFTSTIVSGERADDRLYIPEIKKVQKTVLRHGLLYIGDSKMAAQATRAYLAKAGDYYGCPLPEVQLNENQLKELLAPVWSKKQALTKIERTSAEGEELLIAEGFETTRKQEWKEGKDAPAFGWEERLLIVHSLKWAQAQERGLRERVAKAQKEVGALNERGRGKRHFRTKEELQEAIQAILKRHRVEGFLSCSYEEQVLSREVRRDKEREAGVICEREVRVEVEVDEPALAEAIRLLGWKVSATNAPAEPFPLSKVVLAYRNEYLIEHDFGRLKGATLSLRGVSIWPPTNASKACSAS